MKPVTPCSNRRTAASMSISCDLIVRDAPPEPPALPFLFGYRHAGFPKECLIAVAASGLSTSFLAENLSRTSVC